MTEDVIKPEDVPLEESREIFWAWFDAIRQKEFSHQTNIRAPFNGVFDRREAEVGTYLAPGQACGTMIELDPLLIVADLPEKKEAAAAGGGMGGGDFDY